MPGITKPGIGNPDTEDASYVGETEGAGDDTEDARHVGDAKCARDGRT